MKKMIGIAILLSKQDISLAYRRSTLGPFWLTIGLAVQVIAMGLVFSMIFEAEPQTYIVFLATSLIVWTFITSTLNEGCLAFISAAAIIRQVNLPKMVFVSRSVLRNLYMMGHNVVLLPILYLMFFAFPGPQIVLVIPAIALLCLNLIWMVMVLGIVSARYRDIPPMVNAATTISFFITPVMWSPDLLGNNELAHLMLGLNPLYHWLQTVRLPLVGQLPTFENWMVSFLTAAVGLLMAFLVHKKYRANISYWV